MDISSEFLHAGQSKRFEVANGAASVRVSLSVTTLKMTNRWSLKIDVESSHDGSLGLASNPFVEVEGFEFTVPFFTRIHS
jgi:hypothetical protein